MRLMLLPLLLAAAACQSTAGAPSEPPTFGEGPTPHVRQLGEDPAEAPGIESLDFLVGRWEGEAFGSWAEEAWGPAQGGSMVGSFRLVGEEGPSFYELLLMTPIDGRLNLRVKHFGPDFSPWEEGTDSVNFPLIDVQGSTAWFGGITLHVDGDDLVIYLAMRNGDEVSEEVLRFRRVSG